MSGTFFDYFDGHLRVVFHPVRWGMVPFDLVLHGDVTTETPCDDQLVKGEPVILAQNDVTIRMRIRSALGGFQCLISWLEAVTCGVQKCAFGWDGEGPDGELRWSGAWKSGMLKVIWTEDDLEHRVRLDKAQTVRAFYESFRSYVESDRYAPLDYERLNAGETFELVLEGGDLEALADHLATLSRDPAESLVCVMLDRAFDFDAGHPRCASLARFMELAENREVDQPEGYRWVPAEWEHWDFARRRRDVVEKIYKGGTMIAFGERLRELRSPLVEKWLAEHGQAGPQRTGKDARCTD